MKVKPLIQFTVSADQRPVTSDSDWLQLSEEVRLHGIKASLARPPRGKAASRSAAVSFPKRPLHLAPSYREYGCMRPQVHPRQASGKS